MIKITRTCEPAYNYLKIIQKTSEQQRTQRPPEPKQSQLLRHALYPAKQQFILREKKERKTRGGGERSQKKKPIWMEMSKDMNYA